MIVYNEVREEENKKKKKKDKKKEDNTKRKKINDEITKTGVERDV